MSMKVLITGASGLVGGRICHFLLKKGIKVTKVSRTKKNFKKINWNSEKNLNDLCKSQDIVINCAGVDVNNSKNLNKTKKINSEFPFRIFKAANKNRVKLFIFLSTYHVYDFKKKNIINEKSKLSLKNNYTISKIEGEKKLLKHKKKYTKIVIIRSCNLFGYPIYKNKNCWGLIVNSMIKSLFCDKKFIIKSKNNEYRYYSSVKNFCYFIYFLLKTYKRILKNNNQMILNYTSNINFRLTELTKSICSTLKKPESLIKYKYKRLKEGKKIIFQSLLQKKIYKVKDNFFFNEIKLVALKLKKKNFYSKI